MRRRASTCSPQPLPAGDTMRSTGYYWHHSELVREQRQTFAAPPGALTAGDKKDLVLTNRFWGNLARVAIYGWHRPDGRPIQPLSTVHGARYADYSHGVRLVNAIAYVNGHAASLLELLQDPQLGALLSDEGILRKAGELLRIPGLGRCGPHGLADLLLTRRPVRSAVRG